ANSAVGELVFAAITVEHSGNYDLVPGTTQTEQWDQVFQNINAGGSTQSGLPSTNVTWTFGSGNQWAIGAVPIRPYINVAPTLDSTKNPVLNSVDEDAPPPSGPVGTLVSALVDFASPAGQVDNVTDNDSGALLGIAVTA